MSDELVTCSGCGHYVPGEYLGGGRVDPAKCRARQKNLPSRWVYNKHKCPTNQYCKKVE